MTYYYEQILKIKAEVYPHDYLSEQVIQAKLYIDKNYADKINISQISRAAFFSKYHFIRLFKKNYGRTPYQYLTDVRIAKAKQLLKENISVIEVCYSVGFKSITSFTGLFKKITGTTPHEYQKKQH